MTTYGTLKSDTQAFIARPDTNFSTQLDTFARMMMARIRRELRLSAQLTSITFTPTSDTYALPSDFLEARSITLKDASYVRVLDIYSSEALRETVPLTGDVQVCAFEGANIKFAPAFSSSNTDLQVELVYYAAFSSLSSDSDTNFLLTNAYDLCLKLMCFEAATYCQDEVLAQSFLSQYFLIRDELQESDQYRDFGGSSSVSTGSEYAV